jgi:hypothetical protein
MDRGELPLAEREQLLATYMAGIFRHVRFGTATRTAGARPCNMAI